MSQSLFGLQPLLDAKSSLDRKKNQIIEGEYGKNRAPFFEWEEGRNQPDSLLEVSLDKLAVHFSEENLLHIFSLYNIPQSQIQRYHKLFLEREKINLTEEIIKKGEIFLWEKIQIALTSQFPFLTKRDSYCDLESEIFSSLFLTQYYSLNKILRFFKEFSFFLVKSNFAPLKMQRGYHFVDEFIRLEKDVLFPLFSSIFPLFFEQFPEIPASYKIQSFWQILERFQSTIWILTLSVKVRMFCAKNEYNNKLSFCDQKVNDLFYDMKDLRLESQEHKNIECFSDMKCFCITDKKGLEKHKKCLFKKMEIYFRLQKVLAQLRNTSILYCRRSFNASQQELAHLVNELSEFLKIYNA